MSRYLIDRIEATPNISLQPHTELVRLHGGSDEGLTGAPLAVALRGRIGLELRMIVQGGRRILDKLAAREGDVFRRRPMLQPLDWPLMLWRAALMPSSS